MNLNRLLNDFYERQRQLAARIDRGEAEYIFIDPDGTAGDWTFVVVERPSGVIYGTQCAGLSCEERYVEGLLAPCGGVLSDPEDGRVSSAGLTLPFHSPSGSCFYGAAGRLPEEKLDELAGLVGRIPFWHNVNTHETSRGSLELDRARVYQICEAWVPVKTALGDGVLLWQNCD